MSVDNELLDVLAAALEPPDRRPPPEAVQALRRRAESSTAPPARMAPGRGRLLLAAVAVAAAVAGFAGARVADQLTDRNRSGGVQEFAAQFRSDDGTRSARLEGTRVEVGRIVRLQSDDLPILPKGEYYEVWFIGPGDSEGAPNRISAGTFHPDTLGRTDVVLLAAVDPVKLPVVEVTAEPADGDPRPSGPAVIRSRLAIRG